MSSSAVVDARERLRTVARTLIPRAAINAAVTALGKAVGPATFERLMGRGHRLAGYGLLSGEGLEIGALHAPAPLPATCAVVYVDAMSKEAAQVLFPELDASRLVRVEVIADLDKDGLQMVESSSYDFVVINHVIEHVANPIQVLQEVFRVLRPGGLVAISAPDKRFSFDRSRALTSDAHLIDEYYAGVQAVTDDHYGDFVRAVAPGLSDSDLQHALTAARQRREHAHVWDSKSFGSFMLSAMATIGVQADLRYQSDGDQNRLEHFSVWMKRVRPITL